MIAARPSRRLTLSATISGTSPAVTATNGPSNTVGNGVGPFRAETPTSPPPSTRFRPHPENHGTLTTRTDLRVADADGADLAEVFGRSPLTMIIDLEGDHLQIRKS